MAAAQQTNVLWDWERNPIYMEACRTQVLPGGSNSYHASRDVGVSPTDRTSFIAGQADWSPDNLPEIQYILLAPKDRDYFKRKAVEELKDANGQRVYEQWPQGQTARPLIDFPVLPRQIGSQEYPWIIDAWRKLDPRIKGEDILMRMEPAGRPAKWNTFQQRLVRLRPDFNILSWHQTRNDTANNYPKANILANLTRAQIEMNTTRGTTPGLVIPEYGEDGGRIPLPHHEDSRGFGREFRMRHGQNNSATVNNNNNNNTANTTANTAADSTPISTAGNSAISPARGSNTAAAPTAPRKRRRRPTKRKSKPTADHHSEIKDEDETEEESSEDHEEGSPPRKAFRRSEGTNTPTLARNPAPASRRPNNNRRQTTEQAQRVNTRHPPNNNRHQSVDQVQHVNTQSPRGRTGPQHQQSVSAFADPRIAPYAAPQTASRDPYFMDRLMGRRSTLSTSVIGRSGLRYTDSPAGYRPFSAMDARHERRAPPDFYATMDAAETEIAERSHTGIGRDRDAFIQTGSQGGSGNGGSRDIGGSEEQGDAQARTAQASASPIQPQDQRQRASAGRPSNNQMQPEPQHRRAPPTDDMQGAPNTGSDSVRQTRFVQRPQNAAYPGLLTRYPQPEPLGVDPMAQTLRRNPSAMRAYDMAAWRDMNSAYDVPPALDIHRRMAEQYARFLENQAIRVRMEQGIPTPFSSYGFVQGLHPHFPPPNRPFATDPHFAPPPRVVAQQNTVVQGPPRAPTPAMTPISVASAPDSPGLVAQQDDSAQEVVHLVTISKEQKASAKPRRATSV